MYVDEYILCICVILNLGAVNKHIIQYNTIPALVDWTSVITWLKNTHGKHGKRK